MAKNRKDDEQLVAAINHLLEYLGKIAEAIFDIGNTKRILKKKG